MDQNNKHTKQFFNPIQIGGLALVLIGLSLLVGFYLQSSWMVLILVPVAGMAFLVPGIRNRRIGLIIPGCLVTGIGVGIVAAIGNFLQSTLYQRIGLLIMFFSLGWLFIALIVYFYSGKRTWWAVLTGTILAAIAAVFLFTDLALVDFVFFIVTGTGLALLVWGVVDHLFGLIIPGSLLVGIGPGINYAWGIPLTESALANTGIMLVWFAFGWALIVLFSRLILSKFVWWPLIPGGVLAMVGWGLYIGGNPGSALSFIGNTGSVGLIIIGLYLLLLRNGIRR